MSTAKTYHAFVYGTLKGMHRGQFLGAAKTVENFVLMDGGFPMAALVDAGVGDSNHAGQIVGELYSITENELRSLDDYEGTDDDNTESGSFYTRREVTVSVKGFETTAWMYFGAQAKKQFMTHSQVLPNDLGELEWR